MIAEAIKGLGATTHRGVPERFDPISENHSTRMIVMRRRGARRLIAARAAKDPQRLRVKARGSSGSGADIATSLGCRRSKKSIREDWARPSFSGNHKRQLLTRAIC